MSKFIGPLWESEEELNRRRPNVPSRAMAHYEAQGFDVGPRSWDDFGVALDFEALYGGRDPQVTREPATFERYRYEPTASSEESEDESVPEERSSKAKLIQGEGKGA